MYTSEFPIINLTVDILVEVFTEERSHILLIERKHEPFKGKLALPGGFVEPDELVVDTAVRELYEETGLKIDPANLHLIYVASDPNRDPRGRTISIVYWAIFFVKDIAAEFNLQAGDDAAKVVLLPMDELKRDDLAFDHFDIIMNEVEVEN